MKVYNRKGELVEFEGPMAGLEQLSDAERFILGKKLRYPLQNLQNLKRYLKRLRYHFLNDMDSLPEIVEDDRMFVVKTLYVKNFSTISLEDLSWLMRDIRYTINKQNEGYALELSAISRIFGNLLENGIEYHSIVINSNKGSFEIDAKGALFEEYFGKQLRRLALLKRDLKGDAQESLDSMQFGILLGKIWKFMITSELDYYNRKVITGAILAHFNISTGTKILTAEAYEKSERVDPYRKYPTPSEV